MMQTSKKPLTRPPADDLLFHEKRLKKLGYSKICGVDEAGRGPLAGPVVACACILPDHICIEGITDSKALTPVKRFSLYKKLTTHPDVHYAIGEVSPDVIDSINILQASLLAMKQAVEALSIQPDYLLIDGKDVPDVLTDREAIVKGDSKSLSIAAASIIAKVYRDLLMEKLHEKYPHYHFNKHKGYPTKLHREMIQKYGACMIHRKSFRWI